MTAISTAPDATAPARTAAAHITGIARAPIGARGRFTIALSGGNTPRQVYGLLATPEFAD